MSTSRAWTIAMMTGSMILGGAPVAGQEAPDDRPDIGCWRGRPLPACRGFFVVEAQGSMPVWSSRSTIRIATFRPETFESQLDWNLGFMVNVSEWWAVGGVITVGTGSSDPLTGIKARARRWIQPGLSAEIQAGALRTDAAGGFAQTPLWGATADARLNVKDWGSLFVRWDGVDVPAQASPDGDVFEEGRFHQGLYVGAGAGSTWAVAGTAAGFVVLLALVSSVDWS
jgi:hypothetical protein